jgi:MFS family permease
LTSALGDGAYYVCAALFFTRVVGMSPQEIGIALTIGGGFGLFAGVLLGELADRRGARGTAMLLAIGAGLACATYIFVVRSFAWFVIAASLYMICQRGASTAVRALLAALVDEKERTKASAYMAVAANVGYALGAGLGGVALFFDTPAAYLAVFGIDAASFLVEALVLTRVPAVAPRPTPATGPKLVVLRDRPYALISLLNMIMLLHIPLIDVALPLWTLEHTAAPRWVVALLFMLNTLSVVLIQVRVARGVTGIRSAAAYVRRAGVLLMISCLVFASSAIGASPWWASAALLAAAAFQVVGEMMQFAGGWELSYALAPPNKHGQYQGLFGSGLSAAEMIGPLLLTSLIVIWGPPGWLVMGAILAIPGFAMGPAVRWCERRRAAAAEPRAEAEAEVQAAARVG